MASRVSVNSEKDISKLQELKEQANLAQSEISVKKSKNKELKSKKSQTSKSEGENCLNDSESAKEKLKKNQEEYVKEIFGSGFSSRDYKELGRRFFEMQNNYPLRTAMHTEALVTYIKYAYKRDEAIADDDIDAADKWGKLAAKQATDAKINPSQLSAADLSDGMTSFSQLSAMVEKAQDIIPLLPQFVEEPKDRVDYTLWEYINYIRHLNGQPLIEYKELYKFLNARYESLKKRYKFMKKEDDGKFDENDIDS